jgi:hypothetical protein
MQYSVNDGGFILLHNQLAYISNHIQGVQLVLIRGNTIDTINRSVILMTLKIYSLLYFIRRILW